MGFFRTDEDLGTTIVTIDRPPLNALTTELLEEGASMLRAMAKSPPSAGVVITGSGTTYTAGVDTKAAAGLDRAGRRRLLDAVNGFAAALYRLPCAVVSAVNGHSIGAGGIMCLASDWTVIADTDLRIGLPEAKAGLPFPEVPTIIMAHGLDPVWRRRIALTSQLLGPAEAIAAGLADELAPPAETLARAIERARALEAQPAFRVVKADQRRPALAEIAAFMGEAGAVAVAG